MCNTCVTDIKPGVALGQMGHPSTHMLEDTHTEPKDHTSRTSASSTRTELITGDLPGRSRSPSFSLHLSPSAHLAGNKALEVGWAQIPGAESWLGLQAWCRQWRLGVLALHFLSIPTIPSLPLCFSLTCSCLPLSVLKSPPQWQQIHR